jgi:hypothetical protein
MIARNDKLLSAVLIAALVVECAVLAAALEWLWLLRP